MIDMGVEPKIGGFPPKWMVYNGKPYKNGWFEGFPPIFGNTHIFPLPEKGGSLRQFQSLMLVLVAGSDNMRVSPPVSYRFDETVDMLRNPGKHPGVRCETFRSSQREFEGWDEVISKEDLLESSFIDTYPFVIWWSEPGTCWTSEQMFWEQVTLYMCFLTQYFSAVQNPGLPAPWIDFSLNPGKY